LFKEISEVPQEDQDQTIMIVSHGAFIRTAMEVLSDKEQFDVSGWDDCGIKIMRNTSYMKLAVMRPSDSNKTHVEFQTFHSTSHLPKEMLENDSLTRMAKTPEGKCLSGCFQV
jgi:broad specificity phosphatase PhoE